MNLLKKYRLGWLRICGLILVGSIWLSANQCEAQLIRGGWQRMKFVEGDVVYREKVPKTFIWQPMSNANLGSRSTNRLSERWGRTNALNVKSNDSRYIGGFHYTYFQDLGIPTGDIGLRGNGVIWRPW